ncbi:MAG: pirin family protein [Acidiferrobacterales bacterium]
MITVRPANERGYANHGWLKSRHTFSFADYVDPDFVGFSKLRVINDDRVAAGAGFPTHPHRNMEIVSYVLDGALEHKDSMGNGSVIRPGDVQRMTAGTGVTHSEYNASNKEPVRFLQIWIFPNKNGLKPGYEQKHFDEQQRRGRLRLVGSPDGRDGSILIHQDVQLYAGLFDKDEGDKISQAPGRKYYVHVAKGSVDVDGTRLNEGDGAFIEQHPNLFVQGITNGEVLVFDLPG